MASDRESKSMDAIESDSEARKETLKRNEALRNQRLKKLKMWCPTPSGAPLVRVVKSQWQNEGLGVDLNCNSCRQHIPKSQTFLTHCQFFRPVNSSNVRGTPPLTRLFARCPNCKQAFKLVRNSDSCIFISGATLHQKHGDEVIDCKPVPDKKEIYDLDWNDSHPDVVLQSSSTARSLLDRPPLPGDITVDKEYLEWRRETFRILHDRERIITFPMKEG